MNTFRIGKKILLVIILISTITALMWVKERGYFNNFLISSATLNKDQKLQNYIEQYQKASQKPWQKLNPTQELSIGVHDPIVVVLRQRLQFTGDLAQSVSLKSNPSNFDSILKKAVANFQNRHGLEPNGRVDSLTLKALNVAPSIRLKQIKANLDKLKAFEKAQPDHYIWINIPAFKAEYIDHNKTTWQENIIVGKPAHPTPELSTKITDVMINPYWVVPAGLADRSIIPKIMQDASYIQKHNMRVFDTKTHSEVPLSDFDSAKLQDNPREYFFRQEPGARNPLGQIKYKIVNSKSIYLHDTNTPELFNNTNRALSSGCIRLQNPFTLFDIIMSYDKATFTPTSDIKKILESGKPHNISLNKPLPIFITYITAWVDNKGLLNFREDIYNHGLG